MSEKDEFKRSEFYGLRIILTYHDLIQGIAFLWITTRTDKQKR